MKCSRQFAPLPQAWSRLAASLVPLVIGLGLLAVRPDQHRAIHALAHSHAHAHTYADTGVDTGADADASPGHDHDAPGHHAAGCAIELFASGQVEFVDCTLGPVLPPRVAAVGCVRSQSIHSAHLGLAPPGRAPPSLS